MKVCPSCFNDIELKSFINSNSSEKGQCDYCNDIFNSKLLEIEEILDFFADFLKIFKGDVYGEPLFDLIKRDWNLFSEKTSSRFLLTDILNVLEVSFTSPQHNVNYTDEIITCTSYWWILKEELKWKRRYLTDIDRLFELGWGNFFDKQSILPPNENLYRARIHHTGGDEVFHKAEMGSPKREKVTSGRANPGGIPYLYMSKLVSTTLYEIRATYLDEISIAKFQIKDGEKIILVDFTEDVSAYANMENINEYAKIVLLKKYISLELSKPLRRYDSEIEYIPTQFICEFIRYNSKANFKADGILFNSSLHKGGKNIVLFDQDKVECISVEKHQVTAIKILSKVVT